MVLAVEVALVAREHEDRVVQPAGLLQGLEDPSHSLVDGGEHPLPAANDLIGAAGDRRQRRHAIEGAREGRLAPQVVADVGAPGDRGAGIEPLVARGGDERLGGGGVAQAAVVALDDVGVNGLVRQVEEEGSSVRPPDERDGPVREDVGDVPGDLRQAAVLEEVGVDALPLAGHRDPGVEARPRLRVVPHVPLPDERGLVARLVHRRRERLQLVAPGAAVGVVDDPVGMGIPARQEAGPAGGARRGDHERVAEPRALARDAVDGGCLQVGKRPAAQLVPPEVVDQDDDEVGRARRRRGGRARRGHGEKDREAGR
jgi:hypothetical protein